jgi:hypothetical protein
MLLHMMLFGVGLRGFFDHFIHVVCVPDDWGFAYATSASFWWYSRLSSLWLSGWKPKVWSYWLCLATALLKTLFWEVGPSLMWKLRSWIGRWYHWCTVSFLETSLLENNFVVWVHLLWGVDQGHFFSSSFFVLFYFIYKCVYL